MPGVTFSHPSVRGDLRLRLPPTQVDWSYNLVTRTTDTYAGQVVQVLAINFDKLTVMGRFGHEGPMGSRREGGRLLRRTSKNWNTNLPLGVGLAQMTEWFREYFSVASQGSGRDESVDTNYREEPVTLRYQGALNQMVDIDKSEQVWKVYPTSFPSYRRSNENFAPEWRVECEVAEAPGAIKEAEQMSAIERLRFGDRYTPLNPFSDPAGFYYWNADRSVKKKNLTAWALESARKDTQAIFDHFNVFLGEINEHDLNELVLQAASTPANVAPQPRAAGKKLGQDRIREARARRRLTDETVNFGEEQ